jgi:hypothetical protein
VTLAFGSGLVTLTEQKETKVSLRNLVSFVACRKLSPTRC